VSTAPVHRILGLVPSIETHQPEEHLICLEGHCLCAVLPHALSHHERGLSSSKRQVLDVKFVTSDPGRIRSWNLGRVTVIIRDQSDLRTESCGH
jgi:hypothetical protein